jgi:hypothetical protein
LHRHRKYISAHWRLKGGAVDVGVPAGWVLSSFWVLKRTCVSMVVMVVDLINTLKTTELYTVTIWIPWYVNYVNLEKG